MFATTLPQSASRINDATGLITSHLDGQPAILSTDVAEHFQRKHKDVLRDINKLRSICPESFNGRNFAPVEYNDAKGEKRPAFILTRDAFSLLVMGFTGTAAIRWKLRYIEAFNALEATVLGRRTELAREAGYAQGRDEALSLPAVEARRREGYLEGLKEGRRWRRNRDGLGLLLRAMSYLNKGLSYRDVSRLTGLPRETLHSRVERVRRAVRGEG